MARAASPLAPPRGADVEASIVALATSPGAGARAILRLSGPELLAQLRFAFPKAKLPQDAGRRALSANLPIPALPFALPARIAFWPAPASFTGQDVVEIHLLGSTPLVQALLAHLQAHGFRPARPGEFALRACLAGKLEFAQAEAIQELIQADNPDAQRSALDRIAGGAQGPLMALREDLLLALAEVEAWLDFAEEDLSFVGADELARRLRLGEARCRGLLERIGGRGRGDGAPRVALAGRPNAGKSSLLNALAGRPVALTGTEAGTTRDVLEARLFVGEVSFDLIDGAGVEEAQATEDGIGRSSQALRAGAWREADLLLLCQPVDEPTRQRIELPPGVPWLGVWTKGDLAGMLDLPGTGLRVSARTGEGIEGLRSEIARRLQEAPPRKAVGQTRPLLEMAAVRLGAAAELLESAGYPELVALELREALEALGQLVGAVHSEDLLDRLFGQFCIGK